MQNYFFLVNSIDKTCSLGCVSSSLLGINFPDRTDVGPILVLIMPQASIGMAFLLKREDTQDTCMTLINIMLENAFL